MGNTASSVAATANDAVEPMPRHQDPGRDPPKVNAVSQPQVHRKRRRKTSTNDGHSSPKSKRQRRRISPPASPGDETLRRDNTSSANLALDITTIDAVTEPLSWSSLLQHIKEQLWEEAVYSCLPEKQAFRILAQSTSSKKLERGSIPPQQQQQPILAILPDEEKAEISEACRHCEALNAETPVVSATKSKLPMKPPPPVPPEERTKARCPLCKAVQFHRHAPHCPLHQKAKLGSGTIQRCRPSNKKNNNNRLFQQPAMSCRVLSQILEGLLSTKSDSLPPNNLIAPRAVQTLAHYLYTQCCGCTRTRAAAVEANGSDDTETKDHSNHSNTRSAPEKDNQNGQDCPDSDGESGSLPTSSSSSSSSSSSNQLSENEKPSNTPQQPPPWMERIPWKWYTTNGFPYHSGEFQCPALPAPAESSQSFDDEEDYINLDPDYAVVSGSKIWLLEWNLLLQTATKDASRNLKCNACSTGEILCDGWDRLIPLFGDSTCKLSWIVSIQYQCNQCPYRTSGTCPYFLATLPYNLRKLYPSYLSWVLPTGRFQVTRSRARTMQATLKAQQQQCGAQIARYELQTQYDALYAMEATEFKLRQEMEQSTRNNDPFASDTERNDFPTFEQWFGRVELPTAKEIEMLHRYGNR